MPLALVGLPWLASMIMGFIGGLISWLGQYLSKRILIITALIASWGAAFAVLKGATIGIAAAGSAVLPGELTAIAGVIIPSNLSNFLSTWGGIEFACVVYKVHLRVLGFKAQV